MPGKSSVLFATTPIFLNRNEAGRYLGHSDDWLRTKEKEHDLFKPSLGGGIQGSPCQYHIDHLGIIARHMLSPETFPADLALAAWKRLNQVSLQKLTESITSGNGRKAAQ